MSDHSGDEAAIRQHVKAISDGLNQGNAKAVAARFAPDADTIDAFRVVSTGRENIEQTIQGLLGGPFQGVKWTIQIDHLRFFTSTMAVLDTTFEGRPMQGPPYKLHSVSVLMKYDGQWLTTASRNWVPATLPV